MATMTHEQGARILARHYIDSQPSEAPGTIQALAESVARDGTVLREWEAVALTAPALLAWLGY